MASIKDDGSLVWFITGCSTGLGRALAERVLEHGHRCAVTARKASQIEDIVARFPDRGLALALDVTDDGQVDRALAEASATFGRIDVLVNNAGWGYNSAIEEGEDHVIRAMFDVNVFALASLMRKVLPGMRARGKGHIVNLSSMGGLIGNPGTGYYCATKFAVEAMSQSLAKEAAHLGIRVTLIEPGPFRTDFQGRSMTVSQHSIDAYADTAHARRKQLRESSGKQAGDPLRAADIIIKVVESDDPPLHLLLGKVAFERVRDKIAGHLALIDEWKEVTLSADYPK